MFVCVCMRARACMNACVNACVYLVCMCVCICVHMCACVCICVHEKKVWFYIALYPVHWTAQSALHFPPLADLFIPTPFSASLGSILVMQQLRNKCA